MSQCNCQVWQKTVQGRQPLACHCTGAKWQASRKLTENMPHRQQHRKRQTAALAARTADLCGMSRQRGVVTCLHVQATQRPTHRDETEWAPNPPLKGTKQKSEPPCCHTTDQNTKNGTCCTLAQTSSQSSKRGWPARRKVTLKVPICVMCVMLLND